MQLTLSMRRGVLTERLLFGLVFQKRRSLVDVEDTGIGISAPSRIFEALFTTKERGMGIGLAICQSIIAANGGALVAANRDEGGARFSFSLPR
jgi:signal transduction histidine kinase